MKGVAVFSRSLAGRGLEGAVERADGGKTAIKRDKQDGTTGVFGQKVAGLVNPEVLNIGIEIW